MKFWRGNETIKEISLDKILNEEVIINKPILGICLGYQIMFKKKENKNIEGLGWINGG